MQYTEEQTAAFRQQFSERRRNQLVISVPLVMIVLTLAIASDNRNARALLGMPIEVIGPAFLALVAAAVLFSFRNWRCPACDKYLGKGINPHFCPKCGVALQ